MFVVNHFVAKNLGGAQTKTAARFMIFYDTDEGTPVLDLLQSWCFILDWDLRTLMPTTGAKEITIRSDDGDSPVVRPAGKQDQYCPKHATIRHGQCRVWIEIKARRAEAKRLRSQGAAALGYTGAAVAAADNGGMMVAIGSIRD